MVYSSIAVTLNNFCMEIAGVVESGIRCLFDHWIRDPGWVKSQDPDPGRTTRIIFPRA